MPHVAPGTAQAVAGETRRGGCIRPPCDTDAAWRWPHFSGPPQPAPVLSGHVGPTPHRSAVLHLQPPGPARTDPGPADGAERGDPRVPDQQRQPDRWTPRSQPRRGRADPGAAPGLRVPARPDDLRHRAPELRAQDADRPAGPVPDPPAAPRSVRIPQPGGVGARLGGELPRLDRAVLRRRVGQGDAAAGPAGHRGRLRRRRLADRGHGLGGAEQHRGVGRPAAGDRGQRQRSLLHPDRRRAGQPPERAAHQPALRADPRGGQAQREPGPVGRLDGVRAAARDQDRAEGRAGPAGDVLRPRAEVRRADRRPRHRRGGARPAAGAAVRRPGAGALRDP